MPHPTLQALVLADHVYQDTVTKKFIIAGTFNQIMQLKPPKPSEEPPTAADDDNADNDNTSRPGASLPGERRLQQHEVCHVGSPFVYVSLTNIRSQTALELRYVDLADDSVLLRAEFLVESNDPLETKEGFLQIPPLPVPHTGPYALELLHQGVPLGSHRITVVEVQLPDETQGNA